MVMRAPGGAYNANTLSQPYELGCASSLSLIFKPALESTPTQLVPVPQDEIGNKLPKRLKQW